MNRRARTVTLAVVWALALAWAASNAGYIAPIGWAALAALLAASTWYLALRR